MTVENLERRIQSGSTRISDYARMEMRIQEMLEKHNQVVRGFEMKMQQMKRSLDEQNLKTLGFAEALDEARRELARIKRL